LVLVLSSVLMIGGNAVDAQQITLTQGALSYGDGGAFYAQTSEGEDFTTFCIQSQVDFYPNETYNYTTSLKDSQGQYLSMGAAYLYSQYIGGEIKINDSYEAGLLQTAIWSFQNQVLPSNPATQTYIGDNPYFEDAENELSGLSVAFAPSDGKYSVEVINMTDSNGNPAQNQLIDISFAPEPSQIVSMSLLLGIGGFIYIRGRRVKKI